MMQMKINLKMQCWWAEKFSRSRHFSYWSFSLKISWGCSWMLGEKKWLNTYVENKTKFIIYIKIHARAPRGPWFSWHFSLAFAVLCINACWVCRSSYFLLVISETLNKGCHRKTTIKYYKGSSYKLKWERSLECLNRWNS